tara:strand:- start:13346 stop:14638 length:1293 start_codon:yes stop_codon:yes gene_type:complete
VFERSALDASKKVDEKIKKGTQGKLAGMVVAIKDNICYKNHKISASSKILTGFESLYSATVIEKLLKADAIIIGRLNCDEFAMGSANENSIYGPVLNPHNNNKVAGGSSGGSAAAVAAGLCLVALGSDTGGSIRQPASFCGVVGLKPTYSRVSRHGLIAYASSFDQIGPLTNNIDDAGLVLEVIAGKDDFDATVSNNPIGKYNKHKYKDSPKKIAYIEETLSHALLDKEVKSLFLKKIDKLKQEGHVISSISFPYLDYLVPTYYVLTTAEASSNLSRYDGVRYGYRVESSSDLQEMYFKTRTEGFGDEVKRRIMLGTFVLSAGYNDEYFTKAQKIRRLIYDKTKQIFNDFDFLVSPTSPHTAFDIGIEYTDPIKMYLEDIFTVQANLSGNPAVSVPIGIDSKKLPVGMHIMSSHFNEYNLLYFSKKLSNQ